ncbi:hypothetical protein L7F22_004080 [Adiantum nelumboides]|nr:hypothetical protein [Adiantum nelumboides]
MQQLLNAPSRLIAFSVMRLSPSASASSSQHHRIRCGSAQLSTSSANQPWLLVGLGNPGKLYQGTRHNVGFEMIEAFAEAEGIRMSTAQHKALMGRGVVGSSQVLLAKPQTFVNLSGESVCPFATYYRIPIDQILVIYDDMDLEFARMRLLPKGGHGGHNGGDVPDDGEPDEQPEVEENEEILVPEQILAHKDTKTKGKVRRRFLVKFKNYRALDAKWMEEEDLADTPQIVKLYLEAFGLA